MKRALPILLAVAMLFALCACGGGGNATTTTTSAAAEATTAATTAAATTAAADAAATTEAAAVAAPGDKTTLDIGVLVWKYDDAYGSTVRTAMEKYAKSIGDEMGLTINLNMQDANDSMATQLEQATIMFASKPDFVIINVAEVASGQSLVDLAKENGVPYLFYNKEPTPETIQSVVVDPGAIFVGTTPREAGDMQGEILADLVAANPAIDKNGDGIIQYVMFMGEASNPEAIARSQYSVETAIANGLNLEQLGETMVCNWDQAAAQDAMTAAFARYGDEIEVIFANNDMMGLGALAAINASGYNTGNPDDPYITIIGVDAVEAALESIKAGGMTATVMQDGDAMGKANIRLAINGALGRGWLDGTTYKLSPDGYSVRIPYAKITTDGSIPTGSAPSAEKTSLDIGVLVWKYDDAYGSTVRTAMEKYAKSLGDDMGITINLNMQDANDSMATQLEQATIMFASKPDFVIINVAEVASGQSLVDLAQEYGVPYLFYNKEPTPETIQSVVIDPGAIFIGTTPREAGDMQGEILADLVAKDPSIDKNGDGIIQYVMFMGEASNPEAIARTQYSVETAIANGLTLEQLGETMVCNWDQAAAQDAMTAAFARYGDEIEVIFANNDMMGLGALAAINASGYNTGNPDDPYITIIGVDAVEAALESIRTGGMTATVMQDGDAMGLANIRIAINGALGRSWLDGTDYTLSPDGYSVRIPYAKITD